MSRENSLSLPLLATVLLAAACVELDSARGPSSGIEGVGLDESSFAWVELTTHGMT